MFTCLLYVDLLDLHSFPTRRSSDLREVLPPVSTREGNRLGWQTGAVHLHLYRMVSGRYLREGAGWRAVSSGNRSEEHTSELQSRGHIVCRLLLEIKNNTKKNMIINI